MCSVQKKKHAQGFTVKKGVCLSELANPEMDELELSKTDFCGIQGTDHIEQNLKTL